MILAIVNLATPVAGHNCAIEREKDAKREVAQAIKSERH
jgi:hypothetical protein